MDDPGKTSEQLVPFVGLIKCEETFEASGNKEDCYKISMKCESIVGSRCFMIAYIHGGKQWGESAVSNSILDCNIPNYGFCQWYCQGGYYNPDTTCVRFL